MANILDSDYLVILMHIKGLHFVLGKWDMDHVAISRLRRLIFNILGHIRRDDQVTVG